MMSGSIKTLLVETIISVTYTAGWEKSPAAGEGEGMGEKGKAGRGEGNHFGVPGPGKWRRLMSMNGAGTLRLAKSRDVCAGVAFRDNLGPIEEDVSRGHWFRKSGSSRVLIRQAETNPRRTVLSLPLAAK